MFLLHSFEVKCIGIKIFADSKNQCCTSKLVPILLRQTMHLRYSEIGISGHLSNNTRDVFFE